MNLQGELRVSLTVIISFFLHLVLMLSLFFPALNEDWGTRKMIADSLREPGITRDIIVNINQDERRVVTPKTLLSDKDSEAKGFITRAPGDRWLNNSLDFQLLKGRRGEGSGERKVAVKSGKETILLTDESEVVAFIERKDLASEEAGGGGVLDEVLIPDKNDVSRENAIFYSNDGRFSFNTVKFKDFKYFRDMKDRIAAHWFPPLMANAVIHGYNPLTGSYTPGSTRIMAIPSQEVKMVFVLDREGEVKHVEILDSLGNRPLNESCYDAIRLAKNFGPVPPDLVKGDVLVIPFIFGYYVQ